MKSCTLIAAAAMLQGAMAQGAAEDVPRGPLLNASDIATKVPTFHYSCRQDSVGQIIDGKTVPFPCNAEVQIKSLCDQKSHTVAEMKECLCRKNTDKQPSAFFEVAQACIKCNRCFQLQTTAGGQYFSDRFNRIEEKFCSPENTRTYSEIEAAEGDKMPVDGVYDKNNCILTNKSISILNYAKPEIQSWDAGGRFAKNAKVPETLAGNNSTKGTNGNKNTDLDVLIKPIPVADEITNVCASVLKKGGVVVSELSVSPKFSNGTADSGVKSTVNVCMPFVRSGCTAVVGRITCSNETLRTDLADFNPSDITIMSSLNVTFTGLIKYDTIPGCEPLVEPENLEGNVLARSKVIVSDFLVQSIVRTNVNIQINTIFQQCGVCEEVAKKVKEEPDQPKVAPAQPPTPSVPAPSTPKSGGDKPAGPAPLTPNKETSVQPEEEDVSCEVEDQPTGGQGGLQPPINNINLENKINIEGGGPSPAGPTGPASRNDGVTPEVSSKGIAPSPETEGEAGPGQSRPNRSAPDSEAPKRPMPSGLTPPGSAGRPMPSGVTPSQGKPGVSVSTQTTTTTTSRNGTSTLPSCKGPSCAPQPVVVSGAGAFRASSMVAAAALLVAAL